jgi:subtilisin family serine protease
MNARGCRRGPALLIILLLAGLATASGTEDGRALARAAGPGLPYADGEVLVKLRDGATLGTADVLAAELEAGEVREFRVLSASRQRPYVLLRSAQRTTAELLAALRSHPDVEAASPNYRRRLLRLPNDPRWGRLWGLAKIKAPEAWEQTVGAPGVVMAVIDTGVDYRHEDLAANMWLNPGEVPGNGIDDDSNGFVDDVYGYDFAGDRNGVNDSDPMDIDDHGTHVAGTIAAVGNNATGVCGVNWNARVMALKSFRPDLYLYDSDSIEAIGYAVMMKRDRGVNIVAINASFGGGGEDALQRDAIADAGRYGIAFICAAGNDGADNDAEGFFPANYDLPNIISVAATGENDALASFSNYGAKMVDVAAPGVGILSTVPAGMGQESWLLSAGETLEVNPLQYSGLTPSAGLNGLIYDCGRGDSAAAFPPGVSGNIALIERGNVTFEQKALAAQNAGAAGVVIYNSETGNFSGTLTSQRDWVPVVSLSREDGLRVKARGVHAVTLVNRIGNYGLMDGTSMAAPHVCGALGLLAAKFPSDSMARLITRLYSAADRVAALDGKVRLGARINLQRALSQSLIVTMSVSRRQASAWVVARDYAEIYFVSEKDPGATISNETYTVYRRSGSGGYESLKDITAAQLQSGAFTYYDKYIDRNTTYSYIIQARNAQGDVIALSNEQSI